MSSYENVVGGKLKLKGKALDVKAGGVKKKKKKQRSQIDRAADDLTENQNAISESTELPSDPNDEDADEAQKTGEEKGPSLVDNLTPAEKRYIEQRAQLDVRRLAREADKSHRDRIQDFNQYLANMSEHYDIPKVGPG
ncbi:uncharacterized protein [Rutidosis leptorrhynchoides]|uniref:uncharacterized protein n=1 Tax=Rutidosis leptorrhynchoides TaxID=125765 RepID=UPI003A99A623